MNKFSTNLLCERRWFVLFGSPIKFRFFLRKRSYICRSYSLLFRKLITVSQGRKNHTRPRLKSKAFRLPCEHSANRANGPLGRPLTFPPCLIRFVPKSARNNGGTTRHALFDARCHSRESTLSHQMSQGRKIVTRPGLEPMASRLPCEHSAHWVNEPRGRPLIFPYA